MNKEASEKELWKLCFRYGEYLKDSDIGEAENFQEPISNLALALLKTLKKPIHEVAIMCPDEDCCGCLTEKIVGLPQCNECGKVWKLIEEKPVCGDCPDNIAFGGVCGTGNEHITGTQCSQPGDEGFTAKARLKLDPQDCNSPAILRVWLKDACDIIDRQQKELAELNRKRKIQK